MEALPSSTESESDDTRSVITRTHVQVRDLNVSPLLPSDLSSTPTTVSAASSHHGD